MRDRANKSVSFLPSEETEHELAPSSASSILNRTVELLEMKSSCAEFAQLCEAFASEKEELVKQNRELADKVVDLENENEEDTYAEKATRQTCHYPFFCRGCRG